MTMVTAGPGAVNWSEHTDTFPFLGVSRHLKLPGQARPGHALSGRAGVPWHSAPSRLAEDETLGPCSPPLITQSHWCVHPHAVHPPIHPQGMSSIMLSWIFSPLLTAALSAALFALLRGLVLRSQQAYKRAFFVLPFFVFLTFFM